VHEEGEIGVEREVVPEKGRADFDVRVLERSEFYESFISICDGILKK
jgi:hypothetical protein